MTQGSFCAPGNNRATPYDWLRGLWDFHTDDGVDLETIFTIWNLAEPNTWSVLGNGTGGTYPAAMMSAAAASQGLGTAWDDNAADNGIDR